MTLSRRSFLGSLAAGAAPAAAAERPNILLILADDLGYETLGCNGGESYRTPNLDRLAASGIRFEHAYAQPLCTPTRLQLMTGKYNFRNWRAFGIMDPRERTFGHYLRDAGYRTCIAGKWQFYSYNPPDYEPEWRGRGQAIEQSGFDEYCVWHARETEDKGSRYADPVVYREGAARKLSGRYGPDVFREYLSDFVSRHRDRPFFGYYSHPLTHDPFNPTPRSSEWASGNRLENHPRHFPAMVEYLDEDIGKLVAHLDSLGLRRRTLVLFYSDNGSPRAIRSRWQGQLVQGGKGLPTDAGTRVPMIASWPGVTPAGRVSRDLIDSTDFLPAMAELAGFRPAPGDAWDGRSFAPQLRGRAGRPREWILCHHDPRPGWDKSQFQLVRFARDRRFKLYQDGRLFDIAADPLEEKPLPPGEAAGPRARLGRVLARLR